MEQGRMKRSSKGYEYNGYALNRNVSKNMMTLCKQMWGWDVFDLKTGEKVSPYIFEYLRDAKDFVNKLVEKNKTYSLMFTENDLRILKKAVSEYDFQMFMKQEKMKDRKQGYNPLNPIERTEWDRYQTIQNQCEGILEMINPILKELDE